MHFKSPLQAGLVASCCCASAAVCKTAPQDGKEEFHTFSPSILTNWSSVSKSNNNNQIDFFCVVDKTRRFILKFSSFATAQSDPPHPHPLTQTFHWIPHPCAFAPAHACQRPVFMERGESQRPPVVSLHSA